MIEDVKQLRQYDVQRGQSSISGLSSGAFMTVQMHMAHSASFVGAGIIAGGPYRCADSFRAKAMKKVDANILSSLFICMSPLTPETAPDPEKLAQLAIASAKDGEIDAIKHLADDRLYIFTGSEDKVVFSTVVERTKQFYKQLGVQPKNIVYHQEVAAGHSIITDNPEHSPLETNQPPYINQGGFMQSHDILRHIYPDLSPPAKTLSGRIVRFDQREFFNNETRASMSRFGYAYIPDAVEKGETPAKVHVALHGCKQGYNYTLYKNGKADTQNIPPYGNRYFTTTGYNEIADANNIIVLYPQAEGTDDGVTQNPDGCWDWWGYSCLNPKEPDYYTQNAIQIKAIHAMLERLGG
jgi:predicted esterase